MPNPNAGVNNTQFGWRLEGKIIAIDNGGNLPCYKNFMQIMEFGALELIVLDTASTLHGKSQFADIDGLQVFPNTTLGDGNPSTLFACLDSTLSGTLAPVLNSDLPASLAHKITKLSELPVNTIALDSITGVESFDWISLDCYNDIERIVTQGNKKLRKTLLCNIQIPFTFTHDGQTSWARANELMANFGLRFHCFSGTQTETHMVSEKALEKEQSTRTITYDAIFVPDAERSKHLTSNEREKIAFLLDTVFDIHDLTYQVLEEGSSERAKSYLLSRGYISQFDEEEGAFVFTSEYTPPPWGSEFSKELSMLHKEVQKNV